MLRCCGREPKVRVVVLQREATSRAKWVAVSRFVPHSIVSGLRVNPETRSCLEERNGGKGGSLETHSHCKIYIMYF